MLAPLGSRALVCRSVGNLFAQEWLAGKLHRFTSEGVQVIVTTHSPAFIDYRNLDGLVLVRKHDDGTSVTQHTARTLARYCAGNGAAAADAATVLDHYDVAATTELRAGMFARAVVLVEGPTEAFALPILLRHHEVDLTQLGIACIPVGGKGNLAKWCRLYSAYCIPVYVIFDNDNRDDSKATKRSDILTSLGVAVEEHGKYLQARSLVVEASFAVMGGDFETCLRDLVPGYRQHEQECEQRYGTVGKPFTARWIAARLNAADLQQLAPLAEAIRASVLAPAP